MPRGKLTVVACHNARKAVSARRRAAPPAARACPAPCYNINGCWNDSHMCAQAVCGEAIGMCCGQYGQYWMLLAQARLEFIDG